MEENTIWQGSPSQVINISSFVVNGLAAIAIIAAVVFSSQYVGGLIALGAAMMLLIFPVGAALWRWSDTKARLYTLTSQRLRIKQGVFSRREDELELYRVDDISIEQPFFLRLFGVANVVLASSDRTTPRTIIPAVGASDQLRDKLRSCIEECRDRKRTRVVDFESNDLAP